MKVTIRATRVELFGFCRDGEIVDKERRDAWRHVATQCQRLMNRCWQVWLCHHSNNNSADKLRQHFEAYNRWKETGKGKKPPFPVQACDKKLQQVIYRMAAEEFPDVHSRVRALVMNKWKQTLSNRKSASGSIKGWIAILFGNESIPSFTRPIPIPFDRQNGSLSRDGESYRLTVRIERLTVGDNASRAMGQRFSMVEMCNLMVNKRKSMSVRRIVDRILSGEYTFKGSALVCDRGKWYASISYEMPQRKTVKLNKSRTLYVLPAKARSPFVLLTVDEKGRRDVWRYGGRGRLIEYMRRHVLAERDSRKEHYRWAGSAQKGHGRHRAYTVWTKLSSRWKDGVKRFNHQVTRNMVDLCQQRGIGRIVYWQPVEDQRDRTFLARAGNQPGSAMTWDWFQIGTMLAYKCEEAGIDYETRKSTPRESRTGAGPGDRVRDGVRKDRKPKRRKRAG